METQPSTAHHVPIWTIIVAIIVVAALAAGVMVFARRLATTITSGVSQSTTTKMTGSGGGKNGSAASNSVGWQLAADGWVATSTPPACPNPLNLPTPVSLERVATILYPGQLRGGSYKPHGGFRFDAIKDNQMNVSISMAGSVVRGARYLVSGETQYMFDVMAPCGIMMRYGHLKTLTPTFQTIADTFPAAVEGDSRTASLNQPVTVTAGEALATAIGVQAGQNTFMDWGVYNMNQKNAAAQIAAYTSDPVHDAELAQHAICWLDALSTADQATVKALPAGDPTSGKTSDYCK